MTKTEFVSIDPRQKLNSLPSLPSFNVNTVPIKHFLSTKKKKTAQLFIINRVHWTHSPGERDGQKGFEHSSSKVEALKRNNSKVDKSAI